MARRGLPVSARISAAGVPAACRARMSCRLPRGDARDRGDLRQAGEGSAGGRLSLHHSPTPAHSRRVGLADPFPSPAALTAPTCVGRLPAVAAWLAAGAARAAIAALRGRTARFTAPPSESPDARARLQRGPPERRRAARISHAPRAACQAHHSGNPRWRARRHTARRTARMPPLRHAPGPMRVYASASKPSTRQSPQARAQQSSRKRRMESR